jgi:hypothetical protein
MRFRRRRDILACLLGLWVFILVRQLLAVRSLSGVGLPPGVELPPNYLAEQIVGYSFPSVIGTVVLDSLPFWTLSCGLLSAWIIGGDLSTGVTRTYLVVNPSRARYWGLSVISTLALSLIVLGGVVGVAAAMPLLVAFFGVTIESPPRVGLEIIPFMAGCFLAATIVVLTGALMAVTLRSPMLAAFAFGLVLVLGSQVGKLGTAGWLGLWPAEAAWTLLLATAPAGAAMPSGSGLLLGGATLDGSPSAVLIVWAIGLLLAGYGVFRRRDVIE